MSESDDHMPPPEFFEEMAKHCRCCQECSNPPCDGVCAGGMCDQHCSCEEPDYYEPDEDDNERLG